MESSTSHKKAMIEPHVITLIGVILSTIGAITAGIGAYRQAVKQNQSALEKAAFEKEIRAQSEENAKLSKEIAASQQDLKSAVTGGDSFCSIRPDNITNLNPKLVVEHFGEYAVQDVYVKLLDEDMADKLLKEGVGIVAAVDKSSLHKSIGNVTPAQKFFLTDSTSVNEHSRRYSVYFYGKNGVWHQRLRMKFVDGYWAIAKKIEGLKAEKVLLEHVDPGYPRTNKGEVDWEIH